MSDYFQQQLRENASGMTATGIKASKLKEIPVTLPPLLEQERIVSKIGELIEVCDKLKSNILSAQSTQLNLSNSIARQALN